MGKKEKILFINKDGVYGGSAVSLLLLLKELKRKKYDFSLILCQNGPFEDELKRQNIKYKIIKFKEWRKFIMIFINIIAILKLKRYIKINNFSIIHANSYEVNPLAVFSKSKKTKVICHLRDVISNSKARKFFLHRANLIITVSKFCKQKIKDVNKNIEVIYNGVDINRLSPNNRKIGANSLFTIAIIGNCEPRKAQHIFIKAALQILKTNKKFKFYIMGANDSEYCKSILKLINGFKKYFVILPFKKNIFDYIRKFDIIVITSKMEAFGRTAIEAMALKKVVIATKTGGLKEIINHNKTGLLFKVNDYNTLARYILMLQKNKEKYNKLAEAGYKAVVKKFTSKIYYNKIEQVYKKI